VAITVIRHYYCPTCNKELRLEDMCAIVGHTQKSCRYCHTDIKLLRSDYIHEEHVYEKQSVNKRYN